MASWQAQGRRNSDDGPVGLVTVGGGARGAKAEQVLDELLADIHLCRFAGACRAPGTLQSQLRADRFIPDVCLVQRRTDCDTACTDAGVIERPRLLALGIVLERFRDGPEAMARQSSVGWSVGAHGQSAGDRMQRQHRELICCAMAVAGATRMA
ncbi:MAG TPA: hypothetical protein VFA45_02355 [Actinomycetes bacterium]|jgi:hypothetical protein|nr:hypothetical protein [Actinomycetes bacterium]